MFISQSKKKTKLYGEYDDNYGAELNKQQKEQKRRSN